ncbi:hypothetical protein BJY52DRAFT_1363281 [Lactarius psammicola]|nr:hypothetical protein BJY52DRAFT_1363281 [Lactarius psammicola]
MRQVSRRYLSAYVGGLVFNFSAVPIRFLCSSGGIKRQGRPLKRSVFVSLSTSTPYGMFNNSTGQPQPQVTSAGHDSSNRRSSRASNDTPSSRSALEHGTTLRKGLITDGRTQGREQSFVQGTNGHPVPLLPVYANFWNGAMFPGHGAGNAAGNSSGSDGYPSAPAYGQPMLPNYQSGQTGEHRGIYYSGYPMGTPAAAAAANPVLSTYPPHPPPSVYPIPNADGESAAVWHSSCWINRAERDEVHMTVVLRRSPPA